MAKNLFKKFVGKMEDEPEVIEVEEGSIEDDMDAIGELSVDLIHVLHGAIKNPKRDGKFDIITVKFNADEPSAGLELTREESNYDTLHMAQRRVAEKYAADELERIKKES